MSTHTHVAVKRSGPGKGLGLFAQTSFEPGERIIEYIGEKLPTAVADTLSTKYLFDLGNGFTIDGATRKNTARYINHSCDPNCEAEQQGERIFIHALQHIEAGEELTFDYGDEYFDEFIRPHGCKCAHCAGAPARTS